jgi:hypothetical protein
LRKDSIWEPLRSEPEFGNVVAAAKKCQEDFLAQRAQSVR